MPDPEDSGDILISSGFNGTNHDPAIPSVVDDEAHVRQSKKFDKSTYVAMWQLSRSICKKMTKGRLKFKLFQAAEITLNFMKDPSVMIHVINMNKFMETYP
jgi:hypothetical protein